jgi:hypothetical protein
MKGCAQRVPCAIIVGMQRRSRPFAHHPARGEILLARMVLLICILLAMLVVPIYLWKDNDNTAKAREAAERAANSPPAASAPAEAAPATADAAPVNRNDPDRHGLSFGWIDTTDATRLHAACQGLPKDFQRPHRGGCNPYEGDTSCRTILPLLCSRAGAGAAGGVALATATPVAGFMLAGRDDADARCVQDLGDGWRMASFHDVGGWELPGERAPGTVVDTRHRVWVFIGDQRGNCWDAKP